MANSNTNFKEFTENQNLAVKVYFEHHKNTDVWTLHPQKEIEVVSNEDDLQMSLASVSEEAINRPEQGLLIKIPGMGLYPLRDTAWKGLLDRARVSGNSLTRIDSELLADLLTQCTQVYKNAVRFLIRDEMITAVVSGDETDYKVLPMQVLQSSDFMRILVDVYWINISILQLLRKQLNYNLSTGINKFLKTLSKSKKVIDIFTLTCYSMCQ